MLPLRLATQLRVMEDPTVGLCHTAFRVIDELGQPKFSDEDVTARYSSPSSEGQEGNLTSGAGAEYRELLRGGTGVCLSSVMVRKPVLQELGGFNPLLTLGEDLEFVYRIASEEPVVFLRSILNEYRRHSNNTWSESSTSQAQRLILEQHLLAAESHGRSDDAKAARIGLANLISGRSIFALERAREAQQRHDYAGSVLPLFQALIASPRGTVRALRRAIRRDVLHDVRVVNVALDRIRQHWFGRAEDAKSASRTPQSEDDAELH